MRKLCYDLNHINKRNHSPTQDRRTAFSPITEVLSENGLACCSPECDHSAVGPALWLPSLFGVTQRSSTSSPGITATLNGAARELMEHSNDVDELTSV